MHPGASFPVLFLCRHAGLSPESQAEQGQGPSRDSGALPVSCPGEGLWPRAQAPAVPCVTHVHKGLRIDTNHPAVWAGPPAASHQSPLVGEVQIANTPLTPFSKSTHTFPSCVK